MPRIAAAEYGKDNVRICKVERDPESKIHTVTEMTVTCLLEGAIETSYTEADNSVVVATDSIKNTCHIKARQCPVNPPELYAAFLGQHFLDKYAHISGANVKVVTHRWTRMMLDGGKQPHPHSFLRDGNDTRTVEVRARRDGISVRSGIKGLLVFKSTGSAFHGFVRDEYTTLPEVSDRILSTEVDCGWNWKTFADAKAVEAAKDGFNDAWDKAREVTVKTFAEDESASVQNTMYKMCEQILDLVPETASIEYSLPNKHYFEIDLSWHDGLKNTGKDAQVYAPQTDPNGLINVTVARD